MNLLFATLVLTTLPAADESAAAPADTDLVAIHIFRRETAPEMVYSIDPEEINRLKRVDGWEYKGLLGYGAATPGEGKIKLQRAHRGRWHVFYTKAPEKLPRETELEKFDVWVWEKETEGTVPIYGCSLPDWRDIVYSADKETIKKANEETYNATKVRRKDHGIAFYLRPGEG